MFADTFSNLTPVGGTTSYNFTSSGIAWPGERRKYANRPGGSLDQLVPPPNWANKYPNGYSNDTFPDLAGDEHFQNWMRTAGLPTFAKLYGRNDNDKLLAGTYDVLIDLSMLGHYIFTEYNR
jgi:hypothetical protein